MDDKTINDLCRAEQKALRTIVKKALPRDSNEALERLAYVEAYWRKIGDGENAWLMLSKCIRSLRGEAMADFRAAWELTK